MDAGSHSHVVSAVRGRKTLGHDELSEKQRWAKSVQVHSLRSLQRCRSSQQGPLRSRFFSQRWHSVSCAACSGTMSTCNLARTPNKASSQPSARAKPKRVHRWSSCSPCSLRRPARPPQRVSKSA